MSKPILILNSLLWLICYKTNQPANQPTKLCLQNNVDTFIAWTFLMVDHLLYPISPPLSLSLSLSHRIYIYIYIYLTVFVFFLPLFSFFLSCLFLFPFLSLLLFISFSFFFLSHLSHFLFPFCSLEIIILCFYSPHLVFSSSLSPRL